MNEPTMATLYDKLQLAVKYNVHYDYIKVLVEERPTIDTMNENDRNAFLMADIQIISTGIEFDTKEIKKAQPVMYWKVDNNEQAVMIIGLAWFDEIVHFFKGEVLSP